MKCAHLLLYKRVFRHHSDHISPYKQTEIEEITKNVKMIIEGRQEISMGLLDACLLLIDEDLLKFISMINCLLRCRDLG